MQRALSVLPQGASIIGTHYNSVKCQHGLIVSHWAFDPVEPGQHLPEYAAHFNLTKGVWVERYDFDNSQWVKPGWLNVDRRSTTRKIFDYIFGT